MDAAALLAKTAEAVDTFANELLEDDRTSFDFKEATGVADDVGIHVSTVIKLLKEHGFTYEERPVEKPVRGYKTSSNDRWIGPGSSKTHGGSGHEQIAGWAGQKG